jgi:hypothetical protein
MEKNNRSVSMQAEASAAIVRGLKAAGVDLVAIRSAHQSGERLPPRIALPDKGRALQID